MSLFDHYRPLTKWQRLQGCVLNPCVVVLPSPVSGTGDGGKNNSESTNSLICLDVAALWSQTHRKSAILV